MKTYILQLEQHDDILSVRDKMGWGKSSRILLVWPEHGKVLNRRLDLVLLQRHSLSLGAQLALVTHDSDVRYSAPRLGIPVYKSLRRAQNAHWKVPRRFRKAQAEILAPLLKAGEESLQSETPSPEKHLISRPETQAHRLSPITRLLFFTLGALAVLAIAATLLPSAQVNLTPKTQTQESNIAVTGDPQVSAFSLSGLVPTRPITVTVEGRLSLPASGAMRLPDQPASGRVQFTNMTEQPVRVPKGTVVRDLSVQAVRFAVTQDGEVPLGSGQTLILPVQAILPGSSGNQPAHSLQAIEGLLGTQLSVTNLEPTLHGTDRLEPAPSEEDRHKLAEQLRQSLEQTALSEAQNELAGGDLLIPASLRLINNLEASFQPPDLQPADHLDLNMRLEYEAQVVSAQDIHAVGKAVLDASLPTGYLPKNETLAIKNLTLPELGKDAKAHWMLLARRQIVAELPESQAIQLSLGRPPLQAKSRLQASLSLAGPPQISLFPTWWPRLPVLPFRITIVNLASRQPSVNAAQP